MIEVRGLTKRYGDRTAVDDLSFTAPPGQVTGFLGPNGAGKSTTMRMIVGLDRPTSGTALVNGKRYAQHRAPLQELGVLLEAKAVHPGRSAFHHLMALAYTHGVPKRRVEEVIDLAGLHDVAHKRVGAFSLGMGQRLGIAAALLGDPAIVVLDEPVNGLDPEGVRWVRELLRGLAAEGRTVMLSSHLMSEMAQTADRLVVVGRGRLLAETTVDALVERSEGSGEKGVRVATGEPARLRSLLAAPGVTVTSTGAERLVVSGLDTRRIGQVAAEHQVPLYELVTESLSLEEAFMHLTQDAVEYHSSEAGRAA
ncbi:ABC transporter ATP-binding protein [Streptomyces sp. NBC_01261]|uniref:ABC transporter ATP-binding protein n=1 Tax=unclassified Streptomyces TaxID=2593676 RepID=UPI002E27C993|nr:MULTISPECIES: ABC transporter ATP-binding protein [unclassified Streptomyces]